MKTLAQVTRTPDTRGYVTAKKKWATFINQLHLENITSVAISTQQKLMLIPEEELHVILEQYREGAPFNNIYRYIIEYHKINVGKKALARYWRRALSGFLEAEEQRRELKTAERSLKNLNL